MAAATGIYETQGTFNPDTVIASGRVTFTAAGGAVRAAGKGYTVAKVATGIFEVTFDIPFQDCISAVANMLDGSGNLWPRYVSYTKATKKLRFVFEGTTGTDTDPTDNGGFTFVAVMQRSGLPVK